MPFSSQTRTQVLLWCDRHCCLCKKACGIKIEVHHLVPESEGGSDDIDNAMPLCFDCHSEVMSYNNDHPRGNKYKRDELKARREQVYEEFTRHLVPPLHCEITQLLPGPIKKTREFPNVGFIMRNLSDFLPARVRVRMWSVMERGEIKPYLSDHYCGKKLWNLNPQQMFSGHFNLEEEFIPKGGPLELRIQLTVIDQYGREHQRLPNGYVYVPDTNYWYAEP